MATFSEEQVMLTLAALTYRGFHKVGGAALREDEMRDAIRRGLAELKPVRGGWDLVWGPASYRLPFTLFDDALMYVVRARDHADRYVVAVRGTNPVSATDWLFGDLWVSRQLPWPYGVQSRFPGAMISLSTALGLSMLQHMRSGPPPDGGGVRGIWQFLDDQIGDGFRRSAAKTLEPIGATLAPALRSLRDEVREIAARLPRPPGALDAEDDVKVVERLRGALASPVRQELLARIDDAMARVDDSAQRHRARLSFDLLRFLEGGSRLRAALQSGHDLRSFLAGAVSQASGAVDLVVTGHSKGGALAPTLALWLVDTQGEDSVSPDERWDPERKATIRCYAYAGPTAGDAAFAARSDAIIGPHCHRIPNVKDIVPHAWEAEGIRRIPRLYPEPVNQIPGLDELAAQVIEEVGPLCYRQIGLHVHTLEGQISDRYHSFFGQLVYQHLESYLEQLGLHPLLAVDDFFGPWH